MKTKDQKYKEAVERNLAEALTHNRRAYCGMIFTKAKQRLGIRKTDRTYDSEIKSMLINAK